MKFLSPFVIFLFAWAFASMAVAENHLPTKSGSFDTLKRADGREFRAFVAGPPDAKAGVLVVHDYFGISVATQESVERLGAVGYRAAAVDLYGGKSATTHEEAVKLLQSLDRKTTDKILQAGLDYLKRPGRKLATMGFSMGAQESLNANLNDPEAVSATVMIYGSGFDKIDTKRLERLKGSVLVITGAEDSDATKSGHQFSVQHERGKTTLRDAHLSGSRSRLRATAFQ